MDYSSEKPPSLDAEALTRIAAICVQANDLSAEIARVAAHLQVLMAKHQAIVKDQLPDMILTAGVKEITLTDGTEIKVEDDLRASITTGEKGTIDNRPHAFGWFRKNGFGSMIKMDVISSFGMGEEKKAAKLAEQLLKKKLDVSVKESVHPSTLKAFVKEQLAMMAMPVKKGQKRPVPLPPSITYVSLPLAKITPPKKKRVEGNPF